MAFRLVKCTLHPIDTQQRRVATVVKKRFELPELGGFQSIKLGKGVLGKTAPLAAGIVVLALGTIVILRNADPMIILAVYGSALITVMVFVGCAFWYGQKHPAEALLEGGELVRYREIEIAIDDAKYLDLATDELERASATTDIVIADKMRAARRNPRTPK